MNTTPKLGLSGSIKNSGKLKGTVSQGQIIKGFVSEKNSLGGRVGIGSIIAGISPAVSVEEIENGYRITIVDINGERYFEIYNGIPGEDGVIDYEEVTRIIDQHLEANPPKASITINGEGPDENGNFEIKVQPTETYNVVEF